MNVYSNEQGKEDIYLFIYLKKNHSLQSPTWRPSINSPLTQ